LLYKRYLSTSILDAITDTPVIFIMGPRQCGKTTLGSRARAPSKAKAIKLDNPAQVKLNQQPGTELHMLGGNK
jgi:ABC-type uncharacterized transport system YnjBCD ATPase subunit